MRSPLHLKSVRYINTTFSFTYAHKHQRTEQSPHLQSKASRYVWFERRFRKLLIGNAKVFGMNYQEHVTEVVRLLNHSDEPKGCFALNGQALHRSCNLWRHIVLHTSHGHVDIPSRRLCGRRAGLWLPRPRHRYPTLSLSPVVPWHKTLTDNRIAKTASGLYYLADLVEEHTVLTKKLLTRLIYTNITMQILTWNADLGGSFDDDVEAN